MSEYTARGRSTTRKHIQHLCPENADKTESMSRELRQLPIKRRNRLVDIKPIDPSRANSLSIQTVARDGQVSAWEDELDDACSSSLSPPPPLSSSSGSSRLSMADSAALELGFDHVCFLQMDEGLLLSPTESFAELCLSEAVEDGPGSRMKREEEGKKAGKRLYRGTSIGRVQWRTNLEDVLSARGSGDESTPTPSLSLSGSTVTGGFCSPSNNDHQHKSVSLSVPDLLHERHSKAPKLLPIPPLSPMSTSFTNKSLPNVFLSPPPYTISADQREAFYLSSVSIEFGSNAYDPNQSIQLAPIPTSRQRRTGAGKSARIREWLKANRGIHV